MSFVQVLPGCTLFFCTAEYSQTHSALGVRLDIVQNQLYMLTLHLGHIDGCHATHDRIALSLTILSEVLYGTAVRMCPLGGSDWGRKLHTCLV